MTTLPGAPGRDLPIFDRYEAPSRSLLPLHPDRDLALVTRCLAELVDRAREDLDPLRVGVLLDVLGELRAELAHRGSHEEVRR